MTCCHVIERSATRGSGSAVSIKNIVSKETKKTYFGNLRRGVRPGHDGNESNDVVACHSRRHSRCLQ